ncbi:MAG TPA: SRPBCC domain-containing protein, partial [Propionibacteriaceae bacterium]|nr:SRPBCC domain-containing protein [Propionibacteriaceae bacterium]
MNLTRSFSVPAGLEQAWTAFNRLDRLEPCLPGVTLTGRTGDVYQGSVKIKFGPIALVYDGSSRYLERDIDARRLVIQTQGEDRRGNGTATAATTLHFVEDGQQTNVEV